MRHLSCDIETFSSANLSACGVYRYAADPTFEVLLFGYSIDQGPARVVDLAQGEPIPEEVLRALVDPAVVKSAFNATFERVCLSAFLRRRHPHLLDHGFLDPTQWRCTMVWAASLGLPMSLEAAGKVQVPYASLLGYKKGPNGGLVIDEEQAKTVRRIYALYLAGNSAILIAKTLTDEGIPTPLGRKASSSSTIRSILRNEKYKGDALLQKTFTVDFLTETKKKNEGEVTQYYIEGHHEAIIDPIVWQAAQAEQQRRKGRGKSSQHPFASRIQCEECGGWFGPKTWHSGTPNRKRIWRCNNKYAPGTAPCAAPHVSEEDIKKAFEQAVAELAPPPSQDALNIILEQACPLDELKAKQAKATRRLDEATTRLETEVMRSNHHTNSEDYVRTLEALEEDYRRAQQTVELLNQDLQRAIELKAQIELIHEHRRQHPAPDYSPHAWTTLVDHATVHTDGCITITFKDAAAA